MEQIVLLQIPLNELLDKFRLIVKEELSEFNKADNGEKLISPSEACLMFIPNITKPTLSSWTEKGALNMYKIGGRTWYKQSEILEAAKSLKKFHV